jgi:hypothetical protein
MTTTQNIPAALANWSKNREKVAPARQNVGKPGPFWGKACRSRSASSEPSSTYVQSNRLRLVELLLPAIALAGLMCKETFCNCLDRIYPATRAFDPVRRTVSQTEHHVTSFWHET